MSNQLVPFLLRHCAAGWLSLALLLWTDVGSVGMLVAASDLWPLPLLMLLAGFGFTFGSVAMGAAIMGLGREPGPAGTRRAAPVASRPWSARRWRPRAGAGPFNGGLAR